MKYRKDKAMIKYCECGCGQIVMNGKRFVLGHNGCSEETKKKLSNIMKGRMPWIKGKHHTETTKQKISNSLKGKMSWINGRHHSTETKKKIGLSKKGKRTSIKSEFKNGHPVLQETRNKLSLAQIGKRTGKDNHFFGKKHTEETKRLLSIKNWRGGSKASYQRLKKNNTWIICNRIRASINYALKRSGGSKNGKKTFDILGYTIRELTERLMKTMPNGYTWEDFANGKLHIDHIIPISAFNFSSPEHMDFKRCWGLDNLRLLPATENQTKHAKLSKPFQPSLQI